jgi:putative RNA 2'-phosphotransferase
MEQLKEIVETNDKQRYRFSDDFSKIRASQGHSVSVDLDLKETPPSDILYHGTAERFIASIKKAGLISKNRQHVHLSGDKETAATVGGRHGNPVVLVIDSAKMRGDGCKFYLSDNNVWLVDAVPSGYILWDSINQRKGAGL